MLAHANVPQILYKMLAPISHLFTQGEPPHICLHMLNLLTSTNTCQPSSYLLTNANPPHIY